LPLLLNSATRRKIPLHADRIGWTHFRGGLFRRHWRLIHWENKRLAEFRTGRGSDVHWHHLLRCRRRNWSAQRPAIEGQVVAITKPCATTSAHCSTLPLRN